MKRSYLKGKPKEKMPQELIDKLPDYCELGFRGICDGKFITPAHRHNRSLYKKTYKGQLWDYDQVISACTKCHNHMDENKERRESAFEILREEEDA